MEEFIRKILSNLSTVEEFDASIGEESEESELDDFLSSTRDYHFEIQKTVSELRIKCDSLFGGDKTPVVPTKLFKLPLPPIQIATFENNARNPFAYYNFKKSFRNALAGMPNLTDAQKFIYLKGYLLGEALSIVENLPVIDDSFDLAFEQLDFNFLDSDTS